MMFADAVLGHLVGDYLLQNDWMQSKKTNSVTCAIHCALWTASVMLFTGWPLVLAPVLFALHFVQDRTQIIAAYMELVGQRQFMTGPCAPWSSIVVDNTWHLVGLWAIANLLSA